MLFETDASFAAVVSRFRVLGIDAFGFAFVAFGAGAFAFAFVFFVSSVRRHRRH